jgi:hypothetical protein
LTRWCRVSFPPQTDQSAQRTLAGESPGSQSTRNPSPADGDAVGILPHSMHNSPPTSSSPRSGWTIAARWSPVAVVGAKVVAHEAGVLASEVEHVVPHDRP